MLGPTLQRPEAPGVLRTLTRSSTRTARELELLQQLRRQGLNPTEIEAFGFDPLLLTPVELQAARQEFRDRPRPPGARPEFDRHNPYDWPVWELGPRLCCRPPKFNFVRLTSGDQVRLTPMLERPDP